MKLSDLLLYIAEHEDLQATCRHFELAPAVLQSHLRTLARLAEQARPTAKAAPEASPPLQATQRQLVVHTDGASRGNPGLAGAGWVLTNGGGKMVGKGGMFLGTKTNNEAEYLAAAMGLQAAADLGATHVTLRADSELLVRQVLGRYQVRNPRIVPLHAALIKQAKRFAQFNAEHVRREQNADADAEANRAIDER